jgi:Protein of unknown function (DUF992)
MVMNQVKTAVVVTAAIVLSALGAGPASAASGVKVGALTCSISAGVGLIIASKKSIACTFKPSGGGAVEKYSGSITKVGLDIGITAKSIVGWAVFAPGKLKAGSLAGSYGGGSAEATLGLGLGANVLIGGSKKSVALQPISVQAQAGLNLAVGIAGLRLNYVGK